MSVQSCVDYVLFKNPVSTYSWGLTKSALRGVGLMEASKVSTLAPKPSENALQINRGFIRLASALGASAVILGAYGAHTILNREGNEHGKNVFETANRYHFYHSLAMLAVPFCRFPKASGLTMFLGVAIFCGTCYYESITGDSRLRRFTPVGGTLLILSWIIMVL